MASTKALHYIGYVPVLSYMPALYITRIAGKLPMGMLWKTVHLVIYLSMGRC